MAIQKEFVVRYRDSSHVRFQIPERACHEAVADLLTAQLSRLSGVTDVKVFRAQRKLSIRFQAEVCSFAQLAKQLLYILEELERKGWFKEPERIVVPHLPRLIKPAKQWRISKWFNRQYIAAQETVQAAKVIGKISTKGPKALINDPEKAIVGFLNDVLVLYLIRVHWTRITQEWLLRPWTFRYEWMAVSYLFYLLVRSRRPK